MANVKVRKDGKSDEKIFGIALQPLKIVLLIDNFEQCDKTVQNLPERLPDPIEYVQETFVR